MARFRVPQRSAVIRRRCTLEALLPEGHPARFVWQVLQDVDFSTLEACYATCEGGPGRPPYHPRVIAALWIYGMSQGLETAAVIAQACRVRDDFRWLSGGLAPSDQTVLNLLTHEQELVEIWAQVLKAMHRQGHVDLSAIAEDGSKVHANAGPRSFRSAAEIDAVVNDLRTKMAQKLAQAAQADAQTPERKDRAQLAGVRDRLRRAERAAAELRERAERRDGGQRAQESNGTKPPAAAAVPARFRRTDFRHDAAHNVLMCPGGRTLRLVGTYTDDHGGGAYHLYARRDCSECDLKAQCTRGTGRRVKVPVAEPEPVAVTQLQTPEVTPNSAPRGAADKPSTPRASLTDPEALMMLATSEKRWQPSYNADIAVERHGIIVSQFLTKRPTDFHNFAPALNTVVSTVGCPESWIGDGHYGTHANLLLADQHGVVLYASPEGDVAPASTGGSAPPAPTPDPGPQASKHSHRTEFRHDAERNVVICPANLELRFVGRYPTDNGHGTYRLYARRDCSDCSLKEDCTAGTGRRFKLADGPLSASGADHATEDTARHLAELIRARDARMQQQGDEVMRFRRSTVEPTHAHLKQHGLSRLHVRGLRRGNAVLTLCCTSHNIMKWRARENARALRLAA